jgi:CheY-like chemotaxis protein
MGNIRAGDYVVFTSEQANIAETLKLKRKSQRLNTTLGNGVLRIEVLDSGCGIAEKAQSKLFHPFIQEDSSVTRKYGGTGLGLFILKSILSKMNGSVVLHSTKNIGTDVIVTIPSKDLAVQESISEEKNAHLGIHYSESAPLIRKKHNVLVVDDAHYNLKIFSHYFEKLGLAVTTCDSGKQAYETFIKAGPNFFSFATLDIQMPEMDGITLARVIRKYERSKNLNIMPLVFNSGNCVDEEKQVCLDPHGEIKAQFFLRKPVTFQECSRFTEVLTIPRKNLLFHHAEELTNETQFRMHHTPQESRKS